MKNPEYDIVCIGQPAWDDPHSTSAVLLMKEIAKHHRVLYVDHAVTWKDFFTTLFNGKFKKALRILGLKERIKIHRIDIKRIAVLTLPPILPVNFLPTGKFYFLLTRINGWTASLSIKKAMKKLELRKPVVINAFAPGLGVGLINRLNERANLYYCCDDASHTERNQKHENKIENIYSRNADAVIVSSDALQGAKSTLNKKTFVVKNGIDFDAFQGQLTCKRKNQASIIGFIGDLDSHIDYELLHELITICPEYKFKLVGCMVDKQFETLKQWPNVQWIPQVANNELPSLIQNFDVGIIPLVKSTVTEKIYSLKVNEYLAMGKAVVMTSFTSLPEEFNHLVEKGDNALSFKEKIKGCLQSNTNENFSERKNFAKSNSWEKRADEFCSIIEKVVRTDKLRTS